MSGEFSSLRYAGYWAIQLPYEEHCAMLQTGQLYMVYYSILPTQRHCHGMCGTVILAIMPATSLPTISCCNADNVLTLCHHLMLDMTLALCWNQHQQYNLKQTKCRSKLHPRLIMSVLHAHSLCCIPCKPSCCIRSVQHVDKRHIISVSGVAAAVATHITGSAVIF